MVSRFTLRTATVTDLGTAFGLNLQKAQPVKLEVFEGKVEVATEITNQPRVLTAWRGRLQVNARQMQPLPMADPCRVFDGGGTGAARSVGVARALSGLAVG